MTREQAIEKMSNPEISVSHAVKRSSAGTRASIVRFVSSICGTKVDPGYHMATTRNDNLGTGGKQ
jgi:hypothetical protein